MPRQGSPPGVEPSAPTRTPAIAGDSAAVLDYMLERHVIEKWAQKKREFEKDLLLDELIRRRGGGRFTDLDAVLDGRPGMYVNQRGVQGVGGQGGAGMQGQQQPAHMVPPGMFHPGAGVHGAPHGGYGMYGMLPPGWAPAPVPYGMPHAYPGVMYPPPPGAPGVPGMPGMGVPMGQPGAPGAQPGTAGPSGAPAPSCAAASTARAGETLHSKQLTAGGAGATVPSHSQHPQAFPSQAAHSGHEGGAPKGHGRGGHPMHGRVDGLHGYAFPSDRGTAPQAVPSKQPRSQTSRTHSSHGDGKGGEDGSRPPVTPTKYHRRRMSEKHSARSGLEINADDDILKHKGDESSLSPRMTRRRSSMLKQRRHSKKLGLTSHEPTKWGDKEEAMRAQLDLGFSTDEFSDDDENEDDVDSHSSSVTADGDDRMAVEQIINASAVELARGLFTRYDMDDDGYLDMREYKKYMRHIMHDLDARDQFKKPISIDALAATLKGSRLEAVRRLLLAPPVGSVVTVDGHKQKRYNGKRGRVRRVTKDGFIDLQLAGNETLLCNFDNVLWQDTEKRGAFDSEPEEF